MTNLERFLSLRSYDDLMTTFDVSVPRFNMAKLSDEGRKRSRIVDRESYTERALASLDINAAASKCSAQRTCRVFKRDERRSQKDQDQFLRPGDATWFLTVNASRCSARSDGNGNRCRRASGSANGAGRRV